MSTNHVWVHAAHVRVLLIQQCDEDPTVMSDPLVYLRHYTGIQTRVTLGACCGMRHVMATRVADLQSSPAAACDWDFNPVFYCSFAKVYFKH